MFHSKSCSSVAWTIPASLLRFWCSAGDFPNSFYVGGHRHAPSKRKVLLFAAARPWKLRLL